MSIFIALLRAVNVGRNTLKMERLRALLAELGCQNVRTYVQSGNAVFAVAGSAGHWEAAIQRRLAGETRLNVTVIVRTTAELGKIIAGNPFLSDAGVDPTKLHVTFLATRPQPAAVKKLATVAAGGDRARVAGKHVYLYCLGGYGKTKLNGAMLEKALAVRSTTRNWNTVTTLYEMAAR